MPHILHIPFHSHFGSSPTGGWAWAADNTRWLKGLPRESLGLKVLACDLLAMMFQPQYGGWGVCGKGMFPGAGPPPSLGAHPSYQDDPNFVKRMCLNPACKKLTKFGQQAWVPSMAPHPKTTCKWCKTPFIHLCGPAAVMQAAPKGDGLKGGKGDGSGGRSKIQGKKGKVRAQWPQDWPKGGNPKFHLKVNTQMGHGFRINHGPTLEEGKLAKANL